MVALLGGTPISPAQIAHAQTDQPFSGYATGTQVSANALQLPEAQVLNAQQAFAGATVDSEGLDTPILNEMETLVQPSLPGFNSHGRGTGLELGALQGYEELNAILLSGLAQATAPPPEGFPDPVTTVLGPIDVPPVIYAGLLQGQAQALFDPTTCVIGQPISYGAGEAANVQLLPTGAGGPGGLVNTAAGDGTSTAQTRSYNYLVPNGDGSFGLVSETRQQLAPITVGAPVLPGLPNPVEIRVDGEFVMRLTASGLPGRPPIGPLGSGSSIEFSDPLIVVSVAGVDVVNLQLSDLLAAGLNLPLGVIDLSVGGPPRAIGSDGAPLPAPIAPDGTSVSAAYDLLQLGVLTIPGLTGLDLRVGHMEGAVSVPPGGLHCEIPVTKTASPDPAQAGQDVTITITIPDPAKFDTLFACDLLNISATDEHHVLEGNPRFEVVSASNGGIIDGNSVSWPSLGNYVRGTPPIQLQVVLRILGGTGVIEDIANVSATLGNCTGGVVGQDIAGQVTGDNAGITGTVVFQGPRVGAAGTLPATGGNMVPLLLGGGLLLIALGVRKSVRRAATKAPSA
jgi:hypothetical protein